MEMFAKKKRHHTRAHSPPQSVLASPAHAALHLVRFSREAAGLVAPGPLARALALSLALAMCCLEGGPEESGPSQHQLGLLPHSHWPRLVVRAFHSTRFNSVNVPRALLQLLLLTRALSLSPDVTLPRRSPRLPRATRGWADLFRPNALQVGGLEREREEKAKAESQKAFGGKLHCVHMTPSAQQQVSNKYLVFI